MVRYIYLLYVALMTLQGLSHAEAAARLQTYGHNTIQKQQRISPFTLLIGQFSSPLILLLIGVAITLLLLPSHGDESFILDSVLIIIIVLISGIAGFLEEFKAEKSIEAIKAMSSPSAKVIREGAEHKIDAQHVVPGDIIVLEEGDIIPADAQVMGKGTLQVDESILTGESMPLRKTSPERVYMQTQVTMGSNHAQVTHTGKHTRIGEVAVALDNMVEEPSLFTVDMAHFSKKLMGWILLICAITFVVGTLRFSIEESLVSALALAVAAVPEGLPAIVTAILAIAATSMSKRNALIRKLSALEIMGSVDTICTDKTGTLTENAMQVTTISPKYPEEQALLAFAMRSNHSLRMREGQLRGDKTEEATYTYGREHTDKPELEAVHTFPFDPDRKMMSVVMQGATPQLIVKGALSSILARCTHVSLQGTRLPLTEELRERIRAEEEEMASNALRVLAYAYRDLTSVPKQDALPDTWESDLTYIGLAGMMDPPRKEVHAAILACESAGIRILMLTGDSPVTARAVATQIGLEAGIPVTGDDIENMDDAALLGALKTHHIFARLSPKHKLRITEVLKDTKAVFAMTGDGVNDALALKNAHVGLAMGIRGTEVAKQASDIILTDDNFASIVSAIQEGRRIVLNLRKVVWYLLTSNLAEVTIIVLGTIFLALENPILLPIQLLWINLLTDGLPALALGSDVARPDMMSKRTSYFKGGIITKALGRNILAIAVQKTLILFGIFLCTLPFGEETARSALFMGFVVYEFILIIMIRAHEHQRVFSHPILFVALSISLGLQCLLMYTPLASIFKIVPLGMFPWLIILGFVGIGYCIGAITLNLLRVQEQRTTA